MNACHVQDMHAVNGTTEVEGLVEPQAICWCTMRRKGNSRSEHRNIAPPPRLRMLALRRRTVPDLPDRRHQ